MFAPLQALILAFQLWVPAAPAGSAPASAAAPTASAPPAAATPGPRPDPALRRATDQARAAVSAASSARAPRLAAKQRLAVAYDAELGELDRLKRTRASWRRDRQIAARKAASQDTARRLAVLDEELRRLDAGLGRARRSLVAAIDAELAVDRGRALELGALRRSLVAAVAPPAKRILVPDASFDVAADPEALAEQLAVLERAELDLRREQRLLASREDRYGRMARLREQRDRAAELSRPDDEAVRRTTGRDPARVGVGADAEADDGTRGDADSEPGADSGGGLEDDGAAPPEPSGGPVDDGAAFEASSVALADVVDSTTADALRRAGRSSDPTARREAAARARKQVEVLLERLLRSRQRIERHLRTLDRE